jgi:hypothetical protein
MTSRLRARKVGRAGLLAWFLLAAVPADALVIYRIGGQQRPPPPELGQAGVEFVQLSWTDLDPTAGGETLDLDLSPESIGSLLRDPTVNIAPTAQQEGGEYIGPAIHLPVWDADPTTFWESTPYLCAQFSASYLLCADDFGTVGTVNIALGALYQIDRIRLTSGLRDPGRTVQGVRVFLSRQIPSRSITIQPPFSPWAVEIRDNREQVLDIQLPHNDRTGFVQVAVQQHTESWEVHDIEIYAKGFAGRSVYTSNILDLGRPMAWGQLRWSGSKGEETEVQVQTRSGDDDSPELFWRFTGRGEEKAVVSAAAYAELAPGEKAGMSYDVRGWSFWSTYEFGDSLGTQVVSPSSRRYFQLQVSFAAQGDEGGSLQALEFRASVPLATELVGEVWPVQADVGQATQFTYAMLPTIGAVDAGFDLLEIESPALLGAVRGLRIDEAQAAYTVEVQQPHRIVIRIPRQQAADSGALIEIDLEARILSYGDRFDVSVRDSAQPLEVPQRVSPGDASSQFEGDRLTVATSGAGRRLLQLSTAPAVLTPNGDGRNDVAQIGYELYDITGEAAVDVEIYDLAGRRVRRVHEAAEGVGTYVQTWDGRGENGRLLPPGLYVVRVSAQTDGDAATVTRVLGLAY